MERPPSCFELDSLLLLCAQLPEILFGNNCLELFHEKSGLLFLFEAREALKHWVNLFSKGTFEVSTNYHRGTQLSLENRGLSPEEKCCDPAFFLLNSPGSLSIVCTMSKI